MRFFIFRENRNLPAPAALFTLSGVGGGAFSFTYRTDGVTDQGHGYFPAFFDFVSGRLILEMIALIGEFVNLRNQIAGGLRLGRVSGGLLNRLGSRIVSRRIFVVM